MRRTIRGLPFSISAHAKDVWTTSEVEQRDKLRACRWAVTCSQSAYDRLHGVAPGADIELVYHGLDAGRFPASPRTIGADGSDPSRPVVIACVARAVLKKGLSDLLDALARLPPTLSWRLEHVGGGPLLGKLREQVATLGLDSSVHWHGPGTQETVMAVLRTADIFCLPSRVAPDGDRDGLPNVLMEAMSQELPVVASDVAAIPEIVVAGVTGLLVSEGDAVALAEALACLMTDPPQRDAMGRAGRHRVLTQFTMEQGIDRLAERFGLPPVITVAA